MAKPQYLQQRLIGLLKVIKQGPFLVFQLQALAM
jgi:hypothetical protein